MGNGYVDVPLEEVKEIFKSKLKKGEKLCESWNCLHRIKSQEEYCSSCQLTHYSGTYTKPCLVCSRKILKTSNSGYCDFHNKACLGCSTRIASNENYCYFHSEQLKTLVKQRTSLSNPQEVIRFNTWWNNNLATVISDNSSYTLWVLVYEPAERNRSEILQKFEINQGYDRYNLEGVKNKASSLRNELNGENPILAFYDNSYYSISSYILTSPKVIKEYLPNNSISIGIPLIIKIGLNSYPGNPDNYLKPLDVIKVKKTERIGNSIFSWTAAVDYYHVGIYLGNSKVFHLWHPTTVSKMDAQIGSWDDFLSNATGDLIRYHAPVPFKHYKKVIEHIVKADYVDLWYGKYDLYNRNCEHLVNICKYGVSWSEQIEDAKFSSWWVKSRGGLKRVFNGESFLNENYVNNGRSSSIVLKNEIERSTEKLETILRNKSSADLWSTRNDLEYQYLVEIPPKKECKII